NARSIGIKLANVMAHVARSSLLQLAVFPRGGLTPAEPPLINAEILFRQPQPPNFAQRRPRELAKFEWTIDAKDPRRITSQERWWRETLAPMLESASRREPFIFVKDAGFNYKYFDRSFAVQKEMWFADSPPKMAEGHDIRKMNTERMAFVDSRSEVLIRTVDILTSFLRRLLARKITGDDVSQALGRLQIYQRRKIKHAQSLRLLTLSDQAEGPSELFDVLRAMTRAARTMLKPERPRRRQVQGPRHR